MKVAPLLPEMVSDNQELIDLIIDSIRDIKGKNIVLMDMRQLDDAPTDFFIVCQGESTTQVKAIAEHVKDRVKKEMKTPPNHFEGAGESRWILVDYFTTVVHVFYPETRVYYDLENFWSDAIIHNFAEEEL